MDTPTFNIELQRIGTWNVCPRIGGSRETLTLGIHTHIQDLSCQSPLSTGINITKHMPQDLDTPNPDQDLQKRNRSPHTTTINHHSAEPTGEYPPSRSS